MNKQRLKRIEREIKERTKPETIQYIRVDNNKMIVVEPGCKGIGTQFDYIINAGENLEVREFNLEKLKEEYPGYELLDITEEMEKDAEDFKNNFEL